MDFQEAVRKIEERGDFNRFAEVKPFFEEQLKSLTKDNHIERALCYYYLLASYLKAQLVHETQECIEFYEKMDCEFEAQEKVYLKDKKIPLSERRDFYQLMERCYSSLEFLYERHNFNVRRNAANERKMGYRKNSYYYDKKFLSYLEYLFFQLTSSYGTSLFRWAGTTFVFTLIFAVAYWAVDQFETVRMIPAGLGHLFDYLYFSIVVTTTVGLGDIVPVTEAGKVLVATQGFCGFIMLGIFVGLLQRKF
ncbi:MAG: potassium channel family protein [Patescibacteria group bacterium]